MKFTHYDLGRVSADDTVEITLTGNAANVRLMNASDFNRFRSGKQHHYIGGLMKRSPMQLRIPTSGHWHVTVDMQGLRGTTSSSIRMMPKPLPTMRTSSVGTMPPLIEVMSPAAVRDIPSSHEQTYDVSISHAWEDKEDFVRPLAHALRDAGLQVWYDEFALRIGDSLRRSIDKGLAASRFGLVVLSEHFFLKKWPNYELDGLMTKSDTNDQIILPVWHNIGREEVLAYSPSLADKIARSTDDFSVEEIAADVAELIKERISQAA